MISLRKNLTSRRLTLTILLLSLGGMTAITAMRQDDGEDSERRLWNKKFLAARAKAKTPAGPSSSNALPPSTTQRQDQPQAVQPRDAGVSGADPTEIPDEQLIGITFWRFREATALERNSEKRLLLQQKYLGDRFGAETPFERNNLVRLSIEAPRVEGAYLYVIDSELYANGSVGNPHLIFPSRTVRNGDNEVRAGKVLDLPSLTDNISFFSFDSDRADYAGEQLTIIINPRPLNLPTTDGPPLPLNRQQVAQLRDWERDWGGPVERREDKARLGAMRTAIEKDASEGDRLLTQRDPLPQTIYRVKSKPGGGLLIVLPMRFKQ
jgi:hypothetical protein